MKNKDYKRKKMEKILEIIKKYNIEDKLREKRVSQWRDWSA